MGVFKNLKKKKNPLRIILNITKPRRCIYTSIFFAMTERRKKYVSKAECAYIILIFYITRVGYFLSR